MSMLDAYIPGGALSPSTERELLPKITDLLLEHEGVDPSARGPDRSSGSPRAWIQVDWAVLKTIHAGPNETRNDGYPTVPRAAECIRRALLTTGTGG
jgi:hypothetical protein